MRVSSPRSPAESTSEAVLHGPFPILGQSFFSREHFASCPHSFPGSFSYHSHDLPGPHSLEPDNREIFLLPIGPPHSTLHPTPCLHPTAFASSACCPKKSVCHHC